MAGLREQERAKNTPNVGAEGNPSDEINRAKKAFAQSAMKGFYLLWIAGLKSKPQREQDYVDIGELYARLDEKDQAFEGLEKAYAERADALLRLKEELG